MAADFIAVIDIILRRLRNNCLYLGGVLLICTLDHKQIQSINGRPFLTSSNIIPMFTMVSLKHSVRAANDPAFFRIQQICRYDNKKLENNPALIEEFKQLCRDNLTFVDDWNDRKIHPSTIRLYSKKVPVREATEQFTARVRQHYNSNDIRERTSDDVERARFSQQEWNTASIQSSRQLDSKVKEPRSLLFFRGAIYLCTFNDPHGSFSQSQMALLYDLPSQEQLDNWQKIPILIAPPGTKEIEYDDTKSKQSYLDIGFVEQQIGVTKEYTQSLSNNLQGRRKQYGLKPYVSLTIHSAMGDTLQYMATQISVNDPNFNLWDKGQLVVILSRTKLAKNSIFVGPINDTLNAFLELLMKKNQWSDYIEEVLSLVTINDSSDETLQQELQLQQHRNNSMDQNAFPFRICDITLPVVSSGYVYMLISLRHPNYSYIGTTSCIRSRIQLHNTGNGARATAPAYLRPFALFAYICGFTSNRSDLRYFIENKWKERRDYLISLGNNDQKSWALEANQIINSVSENNDRFGVVPNELKLVCLFDSNINDFHH